MDFSTLHKQRKFILIAAGAGVISAFLPWINAIIISINGLHGKGIIVFLAFIAAGTVSIMGDTTKSLDKATWMIVLIAGAVACFLRQCI